MTIHLGYFLFRFNFSVSYIKSTKKKNYFHYPTILPRNAQLTNHAGPVFVQSWLKYPHFANAVHTTQIKSTERTQSTSISGNLAGYYAYLCTSNKAFFTVHRDSNPKMPTQNRSLLPTPQGTGDQFYFKRKKYPFFYLLSLSGDIMALWQGSMFNKKWWWEKGSPRKEMSVPRSQHTANIVFQTNINYKFLHLSL